MTDPERPWPETHWPEHHWVVDALEDTPHGPVARIELPDGRTVDLPLRGLPDGVREGDTLAVHEGPDGLRARIVPPPSAEPGTRTLTARPGSAPADARRPPTPQQRLDALNAAHPAQPGEEIDL